jgi:exopolyphosphatase / guanosine-5'-triphosphate,3'-diphosphate pyrophosphatase
VSERLLATIDIGTNSVLMQVTRASASRDPSSGGAFEVVSDRATITRLGRGVERTGRLDDGAVERTLAVLDDYAAHARSLGAQVLAVGTSALRDAANSEVFLGRARELLGTPVEVINGVREAELTYLGAAHGLSLEPGPRCVVDIGGGSTEIVRGDGPRVLALTSLDIGAVRLHERHAVGTPASAEQLALVDRDVDTALERSAVAPCPPLIAIAGTATTLAAIAYAVAPYDPLKIHGAQLSAAQIVEIATQLAKLPLDARVRVPGLDLARADVIVAGARILLGVLRAARAPSVIVSNGGVRMGLAVRELQLGIEIHD